jgi:hypothetical protein
LAAILLLQLAYVGTGLLVDPVGTLAVRLHLLGDLIPALRSRRGRRRSRTTGVSDWLP